MDGKGRGEDMAGCEVDVKGEGGGVWGRVWGRYREVGPTEGVV